jgi:hypothetical protein
MSLEKRYQIDVSIDTEKQDWVVQVLSIGDRKVHGVRGTKLGPLFLRASKTIRKKATHAARFPLPEEQRVLILPPQLIVPRGNGK